MFTRTNPRLGDYELLEQLSEGDLGSVYRARHEGSGRIVAVKQFSESVCKNDRFAQRILREIRASSKLDHPNIVQVLEASRDSSGRIFYVMEFVEGESLGQRIDARGRLTPDDAVRIITQVAQALQYAHQNRIIHRDVKPDNILIRTDGHAKLTDFGLAKDDADGVEVTRALTGLGTPHFMAPEQYEDARSATSLSDVYGLGATLYNALTGRLPFADCNSLAALARKVKGDIPSPRDLVPDLPPGVDDAIRRAMHPDPSKRPQSCLEFIQRLTADTDDITLSRRLKAAPPSAVERRLHPRYSVQYGTICVLDTGVVSGEEAEEWPARIVDISQTGIGVILARRFERGTIFNLELPRETHCSRLALQVQVVRLRKEPFGHWFHGCILLEPLAAQELQTLLT